MDLILISTSDHQGGRSEVLGRMLDSMIRASASLDSHRLTLLLLLQNCSTEELASIAKSLPPFVEACAVTGRLSLSAARNLMLRRLVARDAIPADALVAYPDDDCWYPSGFLAHACALFESDPTLDLWFCRYGSQPREAARAEQPVAPRIGTLVRTASSNTIFLRGALVTAIGEFDEALGVGTPAGGSEDLDYAMRAWQMARRVAYSDEVLVGHRDKAPALRARYYGSGLGVLARHARHGAMVPLLRKVAVGVYLVLRADLPLSGFIRDVGRAVSEWRCASTKPLRALKIDP